MLPIESARFDAVWNERKPARFPDVIVLAEDEQDVALAVRFARAEGLRVSVRSGGHSWVGNGVRDGGLLIDLSRLQDVTVDPATRTATVQPSVKGPALQARSPRTGCSSRPDTHPPSASAASSSAATAGTPATSDRPA